ncbi:hypothetical protein F5887DRAFT_152959 [Amanita rubescens]|nr:hypothetical protein F5887DRAFT_152959 [Amanita rubescens]
MSTHAHLSFGHALFPALRRSVILYVFQWLQALVVAPVNAVQDSISSNTPNCTTDQYNWTFNSMGQSPCYVANTLIEQCTGQTYNFASLPFGNVYIFTPPFSNNSCYCNTVWYSLISACAICQNGFIFTWPMYSQNCTQTYLTKYPDPIPSNTIVPSWAYLDVTVEANDAFNFDVASSVAVGSSSTVSASRSFSSTPVSTSLTSTSALTSASASSIPNSLSSHSPKTDAGAIAGGAIGCAFGGALILALLLWLYKKLRASWPSTLAAPSPPSPSWTDTSAILSPPPLTDSPTPVQQVHQVALQKTYVST